MKRRDFFKKTGAGAVALAVAGCAGLQSKKPNIIYILADDLGYGDLGCYAQKNIHTPRLDQMAAEGKRFTDHYAGSTVCAPSRCCLMTGKNTGHARIRGNARVPLEPEDKTVAEVLKERGYTTGLIGKWGLGEAGSTGVPNDQGFDYFFGYLNQIKAHNHYPEFLWRNKEKVKLDNEVVFAESGYAKGVGTATPEPKTYSHDLFSEEAQQFVEKNQDGPFFLALTYTVPHANNEHGIVGRHGMEVPDYGEYQDKDWPEAQKGHAAMVSRMDRDIGKLMDKLQNLGIAENTLVLFSSDNGPHREGGNDPDFQKSSGPLKGLKRDLYEGGIRVPMIAWWPGTVSAGSETDHISAFWDILPTCAEAAGAPVPADTDGISFLSLLKGKTNQQQSHEALYWEFHEGKTSSQAIRKGKWKAVRQDPDGLIELYDLSQDISESRNVAAQNPDVIQTMESILSGARTPNATWQLKHKSTG